MMYTVRIGLRSLFHRRRQYIALFCVCLVGIGVSLFCLFLVEGMLSALEDKARLYYGGDMTFIGGLNDLSFDEVEGFIERLEGVFPPGTLISPRFDFNADRAALYFEGTEVRQRVIKGVDFAREQELFRGFNYLDGGPSQMAGSNGILLSEPIARELGVQVGDAVTFLLITTQGYTNTVPLEVQGIFRDSSLFGMYTSYLDIDCLRESYGMSSHWANRICISLPQGTRLSEKEVEGIQTRLEGMFTMFPLVEDKEVFYAPLLARSFSEPTYALIRLNANLQDLKVIIDAMKLIAAFVILMLLVVIVVGVSSTYRVIVMKRINEIGIYKSIGMRRGGIFRILLSETTVLLTAGCLAGVAFSQMLCRIAGFIPFSFIPAFDIFLVDGMLVPRASAVQSILVCIVVCVTTTFAVLFSVQKSVKATPVEALGSTE